jgi:hypothetical protein
MRRKLVTFVVLALGCSSSTTTTPTTDAAGGDSPASEVETSDDAAVDETPPGTMRVARSCAAPSPCGGDIIGKWTYVRGCLEGASPAACGDAATQTSGTGTLSGSITFTADHFAQEFSYKFAPKLSSDTCACDTVEKGLEARFTLLATCASDSTSTCTCVGESGLGGSGSDRPYTITGSVLSLGFDGDFDYCVEGNKLRLYRHGDGRALDLKTIELER